MGDGSDLELHWRAPNIAELMTARGIANRKQLAEKLVTLGIGESTIYRVFTAHWAGQATTTVLVALAATFGLPLSMLVYEPSEESQREKRQ